MTTINKNLIYIYIIQNLKATGFSVLYANHKTSITVLTM